jgi:hypothetical protein
MPESPYMEDLPKMAVEAVGREMNRSEAANLFEVGISSSDFTPEHDPFHR